jgi:hypothetical protein
MDAHFFTIEDQEMTLQKKRLQEFMVLRAFDLPASSRQAQASVAMVTPVPPSDFSPLLKSLTSG